MHDFIVLVDVVISEGNLGAVIGAVCVDIGNVQLIRHREDFFLIQQIQRLHIRLVAHVGLFSIALQGILKATGGEGLVIGVDTGVDHRNTAARTGIAISPDRARADLPRGGLHSGRILFLAIYDTGLVARLDDDLCNAGHRLNPRNIAISDIGRDQVCCQRQVPANVQLAVQRTLNAVGKEHLLLLQRSAVGHRQAVGRDILRGEAGFQRGGRFQQNRDTNHVRIFIQGKLLSLRSGLAHLVQ